LEGLQLSLFALVSLLKAFVPFYFYVYSYLCGTLATFWGYESYFIDLFDKCHILKINSNSAYNQYYWYKITFHRACLNINKYLLIENRIPLFFLGGGAKKEKGYFNSFHLTHSQITELKHIYT
jgi:hypothetical protein